MVLLGGGGGGGGSKFTRVTTDAIGIVYISSSIQCHIHIYRFGAVMHFIPNRHLHIYGSGAVMHCIPYKHRENCNNKHTLYSHSV